MALRTEDDPAARRDTIILVQVAGQSDASLDSGDSYTAAISHLNGRVPDESTTGSRVGQSHYNSAPSSIGDNRANVNSKVYSRFFSCCCDDIPSGFHCVKQIVGDGASGSYSAAPYSPAIIRQSETNVVNLKLNQWEETLAVIMSESN